MKPLLTVHGLVIPLNLTLTDTEWMARKDRCHG